MSAAANYVGQQLVLSDSRGAIMTPTAKVVAGSLLGFIILLAVVASILDMRYKPKNNKCCGKPCKRHDHHDENSPEDI